MNALLKKITAFYQKRSKRERLILWFTLIAIGGLLVDRLVAEPVIGKLASLDQAIRDEQIAAKKSLHVLVQKDRIQTESKAFSSYSVEAKDPEQEMTSLLKDIETLAEQASVSVLYVKPATVKEEKGTKKYMATLESESEMEQVASFFHSVESSNQLLKIEKYDITPKSKDSSIAHCTITISRTVLSS